MTYAPIVRQCKRGQFILNPADMVCQYMLKYGEWADPEVQLALDIMSKVPGDVLEAGSHVGTHTVPLARALTEDTRLPNSLIIAVEPQRVLFQSLCGNAALNGLTNIRTVNAFLSDHARQAQAQSGPYDVPWNYGAYSMEGGFSQERKYEGELTWEQVQVTTVDRLVEQTGAKLAFMKLDVEGHELQVLEGARRVLDRDRPYMLVECFPHAAAAFARAMRERERKYLCHWFPVARPPDGATCDWGVVCTPDERGEWEPKGLERVSLVGPPATLPPTVKGWPL